ncbi:MAG: radical SAM protein [Minicystis sp.]
MQTTRGCPFDCEFCDVIYLYGRRQRHKPVRQVLDEVRALSALGSRTIFFTDDEFVGDPAYTKELLAALAPVNNAFVTPLRFYTQLTLNLSRDDELLSLIADANFYSALCGIESFDKVALREVGKHQNAAQDPLRAIHHIQAHGMGLWGSFIVGFDGDGPAVFEQLHQDIQRAAVPMAAVSPLTAFENTKLWARMRGEGRVATVRLRRKEEPIGLIPNITPRGMSRVELLEGYRALCAKIHAWDAILARLRAFVSGVKRPPRVREEAYDDTACDRFLAEASRAWGLAPVERDGIGDTLAHVRRVAPYLLPRVVWFLLQSEWLRRYGARFFIGYDRLLELERSGDLVQDTRPLLVPPSFGRAMTGLFPEIFTRLARSLSDEDRIPEAMKEVFVDFIVRWGSSFAELLPEHRAYLLELCDRAAAKHGGQPGSPPRAGEMDLLRAARRRRLLDAVLKDVRDEIATMTAA